jgi:hypothetical protein
MMASTVSWKASSPLQYASLMSTEEELRISNVHGSSAVSQASLLTGKRMSPLIVDGPTWPRKRAAPSTGLSQSTPA